MEVVITMYPHDRLDGAEPRTFTLTKEKRQVDVGRASRNLDRGAQPELDNAVFKCPIMSRSHARFTASPVEKRVYIRDLGSTHGTFIGAVKLRDGIEKPLANGDHVTFCVKVTNGACVYPEKTFRIEYSWQPRQSITATTTSATTSRIFTVPDSDNEDEVVSVHTRESSVQILESNIRTTTYSVPSESDSGSGSVDFEVDDDDLGATSSPLEHSKDTAVKTPEQHVFRAVGHAPTKGEGPTGKTLGLNLKGPKLQEVIAKAAAEGSSQSNPVDLDNQSVPDEEATSLVPNGQQPPLEQTQNSMFEEVDVNETESEDEGPEVLPIQSTAKRSDIADLLNETPVSCRKPLDALLPDSVVPDIDPVDTEKAQIERIIQDTQRRVAEDGAQDGLNTLKVNGSFTAGTTRAVARSDIDDGEEEEEELEEDEDDEMDIVFPHDLDEAVGIHAPGICEPRVKKPRGTQTLPMPSGVPTAEASLTQRAPSPSDAALARTPNNVGFMPGRSCMYSDGFPESTANTRYPEPPSHTWNASSPVTAWTPWRDNQMQHCSYNIAPTYRHALNTHSRPIDPVSQQYYPSADSDFFDDLIPNAFPLTPEPLPFEAPVMRSTEDPSSKLHISNLVNSYSAEPPRLTKRKAAAMSVDTEDVEISTGEFHLSAMSPQTPSPDAQPRRKLSASGTALSSGQSSTPSVKSTRAAVATESSQAEGPTPKRAKTLPSSSGIGKFLIGVGVGAVGLAATFLATIPVHVQEEVRLGM